MKIHKTKMGCGKSVATDLHRELHKSEAVSTQELNHSGVNSRVSHPKTIQSQKEEPSKSEELRGSEKCKNVVVGTTEKPEEVASEEEKNTWNKDQNLEIHIGKALYTDIQSWLVKETLNTKLPTQAQKKYDKEKKKLVGREKSDIRRWFIKEEPVREDPVKCKEAMSNDKDVSEETWIKQNPAGGKDMQEPGEERMADTDDRRIVVNIVNDQKTTKYEKDPVREDPDRYKEVMSNDIDKSEDIGIKQDSAAGKNMQEPGEEKKADSDERRVVVNIGDDPKITKYEKAMKKLGRREKSDIRSWFKEETVVKDTAKEKKIKTNAPEKQEMPYDKDAREVIWKKQDTDDRRVAINILNGPDGEVLVRPYGRNGLELRRIDFKSLSGRNYLNDAIINQYLGLVELRNSKDPGMPSLYTFSTFLYLKLDKFGLEEGMRQTGNWVQKDLREKELVMFPVHKSDHWTLVVVDMRTRTVHYLDSIRGSRRTSAAPRLIKGYMEAYCKAAGEAMTFKVKIRDDAPVQTNGVDCGVFVCQCAERMARGSSLNFSQADLVGTRERMREELLMGEVSTEAVRWRKCEERMSKTKEEKKRQWGTKQVDRQSSKNLKSTVEIQKSKSETKEEKESKTKKTQETTKPKATNKGNRERIDWPKSNSPEWKRLDEDVSSLLKIMFSAPENKAESNPRIIYAMGKERFGIKKQREKTQPSGPSKRQKQCVKLRGEINILKETYKNAPKEEKEGVKQLQNEKIKELRLKKRAETIKKNRKKFTKNCSEFLAQPFQFSRNVIAPKPKGQLESSKSKVEEHLNRAHSDKERDQERCIPGDLWAYEEPCVQFDNSLPSLEAFNKRLKKTRSKSAPGPNGVPYIVYKRCPSIAKLLWFYLRGMWNKNVISESWRKAEGIFIPKEDGATTVDKFRTISLLNVEGKLFFALKADRLVAFTLANSYIDSSIQKGGVPAVSGCMEHTAVLSQLINEAKAENKNLVVTWLDIANAYGSIPHNLIQLALKRAHVPENVCNLVDSYYADMKIRFTTKNYTTEWQPVEKGIITGCTLSVILFALTMTMLVVSVKDETKGPETSSGQRQVNSRLFMDDIATTTENLVQTKYLLDKLVNKLKWAGLAVKPEKCRSLVIIKGDISSRTPIIEGTPITSITEKQVKYLGKVYNKSLNDHEQIEEVMKELKMNLKKIGRCRVPGRYKAWMVQHMLLPRLMWPLTIYNVPETKVNDMQRLITASLKRWLGLPKSLSVECMYTKSGKLQLPYSELTEEVKAAKARLLTTFQEAEDPCVRGANMKVDGGRKANTPASIKNAKERLRMREITGIANTGRQGLGMHPKRYYSSSGKRERRDMVVAAVRETEEERRIVKMTGLAKQGAHTRWEVPEKKLSHRDIISRSETSFKFLVKSVYDLLPTPANKNTWFGTEEKCKLCGGNGTLTHIFSGCQVALSQGRYRYRHDQVLRVIAQCVDARRRENNSTPKNENAKKETKFVREGTVESPRQKLEPDNYLDSTVDWKLKVDLDSRLKVPVEVTDTDLRPDMILVSERTKRMGIIELTVPSEENVEAAGERKKTKYATIREEGKANGWNVRVWAVEIGCRGFPAASMASFLKDIGIRGSERTKQLKKMGETAERASRQIWGWSHFKKWGKDSA